MNRKLVFDQTKLFLLDKMNNIVLAFLAVVVSLSLTTVVLNMIVPADTLLSVFIVSIIRLVFSGALSIAIIRGIRTNSKIKAFDFINVIKENASTLIGIGTLSAIVTTMFAYVLLLVIQVLPFLTSFSYLISMFIEVNVMVIFSFAFYVAEDSEAPDFMQAIKDSFKLSRRNVLSVFLVVLKYIAPLFLVLVVSQILVVQAAAGASLFVNFASLIVSIILLVLLFMVGVQVPTALAFSYEQLKQVKSEQK